VKTGIQKRHGNGKDVDSRLPSRYALRLSFGRGNDGRGGACVLHDKRDLPHERRNDGEFGLSLYNDGKLFRHTHAFSPSFRPSLCHSRENGNPKEYLQTNKNNMKRIDIL
jgi:hypothetical protein